MPGGVPGAAADGGPGKPGEAADADDDGPGPAGASPDRLAALERRLRQALGGLDTARRAERTAVTLRAELESLDRQARADEEAAEEAAEWLGGWEAARQEHQRRIDAALEAAARAERLAAEAGLAGRRLAAAQRRDGLAAEAAQAAERLLDARQEAVAAHETWLELRERHLAGIAAELAARLRDGRPCAVCGATEHPAPARPAAGHVDRAAEDAALAAVRRAEAARDEAGRRSQDLREQLAAAEAAADGGAVPELARALQAAQAAHAEARDAAAGTH
ncbi:SMC family ATPase, partial [Streptomyces sp. B1866]|nr:SMC family ATPase [Streptomyces sp. B1866]